MTTAAADFEIYRFRFWCLDGACKGVRSPEGQVLGWRGRLANGRRVIFESVAEAADYAKRDGSRLIVHERPQ